MKNLLFLLLIVITAVSCSKDEETLFTKTYTMEYKTVGYTEIVDVDVKVTTEKAYVTYTIKNKYVKSEKLNYIRDTIDGYIHCVLYDTGREGWNIRGSLYEENEYPSNINYYYVRDDGHLGRLYATLIEIK